jgi:hypothetical protein
MSETDKLTLIQAKGGQQPCAHGSIYCRRCFGEQISHPGKKTVAVQQKAKAKK